MHAQMTLKFIVDECNVQMNPWKIWEYGKIYIGMYWKLCIQVNKICTGKPLEKCLPSAL